MLSANDIRKLIEVFATKEDIEEVKKEMVTQNQFNEVIEKLDAVYGEVKDIRQEQSAHHQIHEDVREEVTIIKQRLDKVESSV